MTISSVVLPVAGLGTRFLPATKAIPKEMVPILNKPVIQYALEEAAAAGIKHAVFVSSPAKAALEDHFDENPELEAQLVAKSKEALLKAVKETLPAGMKVSFVRQGRPLGLGHAISCARHILDGQPFAVMLPDDFIWSPGKNCLSEMVGLYAEKKVYSISVEEVPFEDASKYGIVTLMDSTLGEKRIAGIVEKPAPELAPSRYAVVGRYVLPAAIWGVLDNVSPGVGGEIQLTDAIATTLDDHCYLAHRIPGRRFDCGSRAGFIKANLAVSMHDPEIGGEIRRFAVAELAYGSNDSNQATSSANQHKFT